jgi:hypothetical protein
VELAPSASRLTESLRDIGYDLESAIADLVDNSVTADARNVSVWMRFDGRESWICIADDGHGMTRSELVEGLRFGSRRTYGAGDLGRFGLGLKTASISQCRRVTVFTRRSRERKRVTALELNLDHIAQVDRWEILEPLPDRMTEIADEFVNRRPGTVVLWRDLDRVIDMTKPDSGWNRRRLELHAESVARHLGMVFHRFLEGSVPDRPTLNISVNGVQVNPWNPFAPTEATRLLGGIRLTVAGGAEVAVRRFVLPARDEFSSPEEFERLGGPRKWNRQQGFYVYRADRMIQSGGWCGLRAADEHTKLARVSLDFPTSVDPDFKIDVSKMRVALPPEIKALLVQPINEVVQLADARYRHHGTRKPAAPSSPTSPPDLGAVGASLVVAALEEGLSDELDRILKRVGSSDPLTAQALGW